MVINRKDLLNIIKEKCQGMKYSVGLHGANATSGFSSVPDDEVLKRIEEEGLISNRALTGTIAFFGRGDIISNDSKNKMEFDNYDYNTDYYAIFVFPTYIKISNGRELFLGNTNLDSKYSKYFDSPGHELTSLADLAYKQQIIDRRFVFGTFKKLDNQNIDLHLNPYFINNDEFDFNLLYKIFDSPISRKILEQYKLDKLLHLGLTREEKQELKKVELELLNILSTSNNEYLIQMVYVPILETIDQLQLEEKLEIEYVTNRLQLLKDDYYKVFNDVMNDVNFFKYGLRQLNNIVDEQLNKEFRTYFLYSSNPIIFRNPELVNLAFKNKIDIVDRIPVEVLDNNLIQETAAHEENKAENCNKICR